MTPSPTPSCLATNKKMTTLYASGMRHYMGVGSFKASELTVENTIHLSTRTSSLMSRRRRASSPMFEPVFLFRMQACAGPWVLTRFVSIQSRSLLLHDASKTISKRPLLRHARNLQWFCNACGAQGTGCVTKQARCKDGIERLETRCCNRVSCGTVLLQ